METIGIAMVCAGAAWIVYVFAGYPALVWLWGRLRPVSHSSNDHFTPTVAVLIAARNEAKDIGWKVRETLDWDYPADRLQVLVASDASDDATDQVVSEIGDPRVRLVRMERRGGKVRGLNRLIRSTQADLLLFTDANARIASDVLRRMVRHFADARVGCVTGRTVCAGSAAPVGAGAAIYWDYEAIVAEWESRAGAVLVCDGALHCVRRTAIAELLPQLANDLETPVRTRAKGYLNLFEPQAIVRESETQSQREEFARRRRICGQGALALWELRSEMSAAMAWQFLSRKLLRWVIAVPLLLVLGGSALVVREPFFAVLLVLQGAFYGMAAAAHFFSSEALLAVPGLAVPYYTVLGALGAVRGVLDCAGGRRFDVWEIPALSRGR